MPSNQPSLQLRNIIKRYNNYQAIHGVSFEAEPGEFVVMVGPSGCGKSTLLRSIAGLEDVSEGEIVLNGRDITHIEPSQRGVAMVFQNYALYPHMTVAENMGFALRTAGRPKAEVRAAVEEAARILRITEHLDKKPKALSGGQKQRVAIGRAITRSPELFLFDEPLSNLDAALRTQMRIELGRLHEELKATMVYVTHDQTEAMTMADRIVVLNAGRIEQMGAPLELYNRPANIFVAGFLGAPRMNFIAATVTGAAPGSVTLALPGQDAPLTLELEPGAALPAEGSTLRLGLRPEAIFLGDAPATATLTLPATTAIVESLGRETVLFADAGPLRALEGESQDGYLAIQAPRQIMARHGSPLSLSVDPAAFFLFDADGRTIRFGK